MELLQAIADNTEAKDSFYIIATAKGSSTITQSFSPPLIFRQRSNGTTNYEMALVGLNTYYSFPNIDETNNTVTFFKRIKDGWEEINTIKLGTGCYEVDAIDKEIRRQMGWGKDPPVRFAANNSTLNCVMTVKKDYKVNLAVENSLATVLGFTEKEYYEGRWESDEIVNILKVNSILVFSDIISGSRVDGLEKPMIFHFSPNVAPGIKIVIEPHLPIYLPITVDTISQMTIWLTDQEERPIDLRGENIVFNFHVRAR